jgi:hypothetical protein
MTSYRLEVRNLAPVRGQRAAHVTGLNEVGALAVPYIVLRNDHMDSLATGLAVSEFAPRWHCRCRIPRSVGVVKT